MNTVEEIIRDTEATLERAKVGYPQQVCRKKLSNNANSSQLVGALVPGFLICTLSGYAAALSRAYLLAEKRNTLVRSCWRYKMFRVFVVSHLVTAYFPCPGLTRQVYFSGAQMRLFSPG